MTTARAWLLKKRSLGRRLSGRVGRLDGRGRHRPALRGEEVDSADQQDDRERRLVDRKVADQSLDAQGASTREVRQDAQRWVLPAGAEITRPQEVDLHRDAPDKSEDVYDHAPGAELERSCVLRP